MWITKLEFMLNTDVSSIILNYHYDYEKLKFQIINDINLLRPIEIFNSDVQPITSKMLDKIHWQEQVITREISIKLKNVIILNKSHRFILLSNKYPKYL